MKRSSDGWLGAGRGEPGGAAEDQFPFTSSFPAWLPPSQKNDAHQIYTFPLKKNQIYVTFVFSNTLPP
jgi:hypothetical protein